MSPEKRKPRKKSKPSPSDQPTITETIRSILEGRQAQTGEPVPDLPDVERTEPAPTTTGGPVYTAPPSPPPAPLPEEPAPPPGPQPPPPSQPLRLARAQGDDGVPEEFTGREQWMVSGFYRQATASIIGLLAGWTALAIALWAAALGALLGVLIAGDVVATTSFTRSLFHAGAGEAVTFLAIAGGALAGAGGAFLATYGGFLYGDPYPVIVSVLCGAFIAVGIVAAVIAFEHTLLTWRGYRRLSRDEAQRVLPLAEDAAKRMGLGRIPTFAIAEIPGPRAWTHTRTIVISKGMLNTLSNNNELRAVIGHELNHWRKGDGLALSFVWACAWPITVGYSLGVWLSGKDLNSEETKGRKPRGLLGWVGWFILWPTWLLANGLLVPIIAMQQRKYEYEADAAVKDIGDGPQLAKALKTLSAFEVGRTGWEYAITKQHPPTELRLEALQDAAADDDPYKPQELRTLPVGLIAKTALVIVGVLLVLGVVVNDNRSTSAVTPTPVPPPTVPTTPPTVPPSPTPSGQSPTAGDPHTQAGATAAGSAFSAALAKAVLNRNAYVAVIDSATYQQAESGLVAEVDQRWASTASQLSGHSVTTSVTAGPATLTDYQTDPAGDHAFVNTTVTLNYTVDGKPSVTTINGRFVLTWFDVNGWNVTDIVQFNPATGNARRR